MKKTKLPFFTLHVLLILSFAITPQLCYPEPYNVLIVPGLGGGGAQGVGRVFYEKNFSGYDTVEIFEKLSDNDLGQKNCQEKFNQKLQGNGKVDFIYASSQGTATVLNSTAISPSILKDCKGVVLEASLGSGNSGIYQEVYENFNSKVSIKIPKFPGSYYILPYLATMVLRHYSPAGQQAIFSVEHFPKDIPIVLMHAKDDSEVPFSDSCALYYKLKEQGNNVYFIPIESEEHCDLCFHEDCSNEIKAIRKILNLSKDDVNLLQYQPNHQRFKQHYDLLVTRENRIRMISKIFPWLFLFGGLTLLYKYILPSTLKETLSIANLPSLGATFRTNFCSALVGGMKAQNGVHNL